jgi:hypothetical protein
MTCASVPTQVRFSSSVAAASGIEAGVWRDTTGSGSGVGASAGRVTGGSLWSGDLVSVAEAIVTCATGCGVVVISSRTVVLATGEALTEFGSECAAGFGGASSVGGVGSVGSSATRFGGAVCVSGAGRACAAGAGNSADIGSGKPNPAGGSGRLQGSARRNVLRSGGTMPRRLALPRTAFADRSSRMPMTSGWIPACRHRIRRLVSMTDQPRAPARRRGLSWGVDNPSRTRLRSSAARDRSR